MKYFGFIVMGFPLRPDEIPRGRREMRIKGFARTIDAFYANGSIGGARMNSGTFGENSRLAHADPVYKSDKGLTTKILGC